MTSDIMCACGLAKEDCEYHKDDSVKHPFNISKRFERVSKGVGDPDLSGMVDRFSLLTPDTFAFARSMRVPVAIVAGDDGWIRIRPDVTFRPTHIVLSDMASQCFDLVGYQLSNVGMIISGDHLPLETFSIKYMQDDRLSAINEWQGAPTINPACMLSMIVSRNEFGKKHPDVKFRGLVWGLATW